MYGTLWEMEVKLEAINSGIIRESDSASRTLTNPELCILYFYNSKLSKNENEQNILLEMYCGAGIRFGNGRRIHSIAGSKQLLERLQIIFLQPFLF